MFMADGWRNYEILDCSDGEKLERWGDKILVPTPKLYGERKRTHRNGIPPTLGITAAKAAAEAGRVLKSCRRYGR